ncbi:MAG: hypothetical protein JXB10_18770 [Pirellulales bacterium]|nr:hypothetical protein [Pirellulales bacterium]
MHSTPPVTRLASWALFLAAGTFLFIALLTPAPAPAAQTDSFDWLFDRSFYTNNPKTGKRVWQYKPSPSPFRDPYAVYDSSTSSYPFEPDGYDPYPYYYNPYYSPWMYPGSPGRSGWYYGWNVNNYYPYSGGQVD